MKLVILGVEIIDYPVGNGQKIHGKLVPRDTLTVHIYLFMGLLFNKAILELIDKEFETSSSISSLEKS